MSDSNAQPGVKRAIERFFQLVSMRDPNVLAEFAPGDDLILGEDVVGPNGNILIHRGTQLTGILLEKLVELNEIGIMADAVKIIR